MSAGWVRGVGVVLALTMTWGCSKETPQPEAEKEEEVPAPAPSAAVPTEKSDIPLSPEKPTTKVDGVVTAEDLEEEAAKTVQLDNLEAELDRLEAEISGGG